MFAKYLHSNVRRILDNMTAVEEPERRKGSTNKSSPLHIEQTRRCLQRLEAATRAVKKKNRQKNSFLSQLTTSSLRVGIVKPRADRWLVPQKPHLALLPSDGRLHNADYPHFSQNQASDSALSAATHSIHHICPDSHDGCGTERPISDLYAGKH